MTTLFFTSADPKYECFIAPYAASVLHHNTDAIIEFAVEDTERAKAEHAKSLAILNAYFPDRITLRSADFTKSKPNTIRFITDPVNHCEYTYIGDIDIIVLDRVTPMHLGNMANTCLPFSNVTRKNRPALTGLHFTRSDAYYPLVLDPSWNLAGDDEELLYKIVAARGLPMPTNNFRPVHGIHMSMNRRPVGRAGEAGWDIGRREIEKFQSLRQSAMWSELAPTFHPRFTMMLLLLQVAVDCLHPDLNTDADPRVEFVKLSKKMLYTI
jgi:hypothetical protein